MKLVNPIDLTGASKARAVCLPGREDLTFGKGTLFTVSGWGTLKFSTEGEWPDVLHSVEVPHVTDDLCNKGDQLGLVHTGLKWT